MTDDDGPVVDANTPAGKAMDAGLTAGLDAEDGTVTEGSGLPSGGENWSAWSNLWQVPAILLSILLIGVGLYVASERRPEQDFDRVLDHVRHLIAVNDLNEARGLLQGVIEPHLELATPQQRARYHANVADWVVATQATRQVSVAENNRIITQQYQLAVDSGMVMSELRIERWAHALIDLGDIDRARERLAELEALSITEVGDDARGRRNRVLRRLVEHSLAQEELSEEAVMAVLESYRADPMLSVHDRAWVAEQSARVRLETGDATGAVERLLVDMRRLEQTEAAPESDAWGRLYTLLGRGYYDQGLYDHARYHLDEALGRFRSSVERGEALLILAHLRQAEGDIEGAHARFDEVVEGHLGTSAHLAALLGRAGTASILGEHEAALADFQTVIDGIDDARPRRDVTRRIVAARLADRHDAALTMGDLDLALQYVDLAEGLFDVATVPADVLFRIGSTSRQIADDLMAEAMVDDAGEAIAIGDTDPELRFRAVEKYEQAADYYLRHARALASVSDADEEWADSLWWSGDSYDLAGQRRQAIRHFIEYIAGRPVDDPRRAQVTYRLGQAYHAEGENEAAVRTYEQVLAEHPRSAEGTRSHVPLARCLVALGRTRDAEQQLIAVVDGRHTRDTPIQPDAVDYREALLELGKLFYDTGQTKPAIERLTVALTRYPDDPRVHEVEFRLADSHRRHAKALEADLRTRPTMAPQDRLAQEQFVREHREQAMALFARSADGYDRLDQRRLNLLQRDYRRHAAFSRAECAYDLGRYETAAELYDHVARRYSDHHSSMHALVQIVNCFDHLGRGRDADIAHENALTRLRQLPDTAFEDPQALLDRVAWERWLQNRPVGLKQVASERTMESP